MIQEALAKNKQTKTPQQLVSYLPVYPNVFGPVSRKKEFVVVVVVAWCNIIITEPATAV